MALPIEMEMVKASAEMVALEMLENKSDEYKRGFLEGREALREEFEILIKLAFKDVRN